MGTLPTGTVTFLFTDIEGSTKLAQQYPDDIAALLARHNEILDQTIQAQNGFVFRIVGDAYCVAFHNASDALYAALDAQRQLHNESWSPARIKVRMGIHTGVAQLEDELGESTYSGYSTLALVQRVMAAGHGGQVLLSQTVHDLLRDQLPAEAQLIDMGERHLKDILRPEHLYQLAVPDLPSEFPALKTLEIINHNLPINLTSFIGRERELSETKDKLEGARLLTLIGPGGTGKTRLALQIAAGQLSKFKDGVWLVELAPVSDPAFIVSTIATVFNVREVQSIPLIHLVMDYLRAKETLLVLDNCEHLVEASAQIADQLLHTCPNLKIIASSREALGIDGETVYRVPSLRDDEATRLFIERATKAEPRFQVTDENASFIAQICSRLDGIPLAIELAAARVKLFTPEQIAARLDDRFKLLTGGSRTALPRQQTLRALIDWSFLSLNENEQRTLRRLAVFSGGWTIEAAESVLGEEEALDGLLGLVNKSLVNVEEQHGTARYRFLETIRQYALEKLLESGEAEQLRDLHLDFFAKFAENIVPKLEDLYALEWQVRLEAEYDNIRSALEWGLEKNLQAVFSIILALNAFWMRRGHETEGRHWATEALSRQARLPKVEGEAARQQMTIVARVWESLTFLAFSQGDAVSAIEAADHCIDLGHQLGDKRLQAIALAYKASGTMTYLGMSEGVEKMVKDSLAFARESGDPFALGMALSLGGQAKAIMHQDFKIARAYLEEGNALFSSSRNPWGAMMARMSLGMTAKYLGEYEQARLQFTACLPLFQKIGDQHRFNMMKSELAHLDRHENHYEEAESAYRETILEWQRLGHRAAVANQLECFAFIAKARELDERAVRLFGAAEALRERIRIQMTPLERAEYDREVVDLKANMAEEIFSFNWNEGRTLTMEQAIEYALGNPI